MADVLKFVDAADPSATVRLDLNDDTGVLHVREVAWSPPRLRRGVSQNTMTDGGYVGPSTYDLRTLGLAFDVIASDVDTLAGHLQALNRELDRATNWLMYQPTGASQPVFFKTYRSDKSALVDVPAAVAFRQLGVDLLTDPHAYGAEETVTVGTVTNNPAGGCYFDVASVKGDVAAPMEVRDSTVTAVSSLVAFAVRQSGIPANMLRFVQAEAMLPISADTTNPGGAADGTMSGTGTTNYLRTTFATTTAMASRLGLAPLTTSDAERAEIAGTYRLFVFGRQNGAGVINIKARVTETFTDTVPTPGVVGSRFALDLGLVTFQEVAGGIPYLDFNLWAERVSGTPTLDWDAVAFAPASEALFLAEVPYSGSASTYAAIDGRNGLLYNASGAVSPPQLTGPTKPYTGSIPMLKPGVTNRFTWFKYAASDGASPVSSTSSITLRYHPRYELLRPPAT